MTAFLIRCSGIQVDERDFEGTSCEKGYDWCLCLVRHQRVSLQDGKLQGARLKGALCSVRMEPT